MGVPYPGATLASTGGTAPVTWSVTPGSLPAGLSLDPYHRCRSPGRRPVTVGTTSFTVTATDSSSPVPQSVIGSPVDRRDRRPLDHHHHRHCPMGRSVAPYPGATLASTGGTAPITWAVTTGHLPAGLTLSGAGVISGAPTAAGTATSR